MVPLELPPPRDWQVFEDFCRDLFAAEWGDPDAQKHGRSGQNQHGVDVFGRREGRWQAVQCKRRSLFPEAKLTEREIRREVTAAQTFGQPLETLVIATTAPPDTRVQAVAMQLTESHGEAGPRVVVYGWSELCEKLALHEPVDRVWRRRLLERRPTPSFSNDVSRELAEALEKAHEEHEELTSTGQDPALAFEKILEIKRRMREGGQLQPGDYLCDGRLRLLELLGRGGFANVFKAYDRESCQLVAVKVLHGQYAQDRSRRGRFFRGARKMAELQHHGIVRVIEPKLEDDGYWFFVMEYAGGGDLRQAVLEDRIRDLTILRDVAEALDFAHRQGVVHRDVKPANILLTDEGEAKLTDFDLVRAADTTGGTRTGRMLGTFLYMAPEAMHQAKDIDSSADVYSLAMTAAFVLSGEELPPAILRDPGGFFARVEMTPSARKALEQAASWEPDQRPKRATDLMKALEAAEPATTGESARVTEGAQAITPSAPGELAQALAQLKDWRQRRERIEQLPAGARDPESALRDLERASEATRNGSDLFFLERAVEAVAKRWPDVERVAAGLQARFYDHIPAPLEELFQWIETRDGRAELWRKIPAGNFKMGSPEGEEAGYDDERPQHEVTLRSPFRMAAVPVTVAQYAAFDPEHVSYFQDKVPEDHIGSHPVEQVSWYEACAFCRWLSNRVAGVEGARLPTEEEWEYACRAGTTTRYWEGDGESDLEQVGWYGANSEGRTHRVGRKPANPWGLYDVHGNVLEWTLSEWSDDYSGREGGLALDPSAVELPESPGARVCRGGSCWSGARDARSACRDWFDPGFGLRDQGFRVLLPAPRAVSSLDLRS